MRHAIVIARQADGGIKSFISPTEDVAEAEARYHEWVNDHTLEEVQYFFRPPPHWFHRPAEAKHNRDRELADAETERQAKAAETLAAARKAASDAAEKAKVAAEALAALEPAPAPAEPSQAPKKSGKA